MADFIEIDDITPKIQYISAAGQTDFTYQFIAFDDTDLVVYVNDVVKTITVDYTVDNLFPEEGGTVVFNEGLDVDDEITLIRETPVAKTTGWLTGGDFRATTLDNQNAQFIAMVQQTERKLDGAVKLSATSTVVNAQIIDDPVDNTMLVWRGTDGDLANSDISINDISTAVDEAEASATAAAASESAAATSASNALSSASDSETSATEAAASAASIALPAIPVDENFLQYSSSAVEYESRTPEEVAEILADTGIISGTPDDYLTGLEMEQATDTDHDITINNGLCRDSTNAETIEFTSAITKQIDADWMAGSDMGGFPSGLTLLADKWYHVFVLYNPTTDAVDAGFDIDISASNLLADATDYTAFRRIGSVLTDASLNITPFLQTGSYFYLKDDTVDLDKTTTTDETDIYLTLTVPIGVKVRPLFRTHCQWSVGTGRTAWFYSPEGVWSANIYSKFEAGVTPFPASQLQSGNCSGSIYTNTSGQIRYTHTGANNEVFRLWTYGYIDPRGGSGDIISGGGGGGAIDSVNGQTGVVVLDTGDLLEATDANYVTDAQLVVVGNTSGTNTGDQVIPTLTSDLTNDSVVASVIAGSNITVDVTDPRNPVINSTDGGTGEANTASNVGTSGLGLFKQKTGTDLEFDNIDVGSNKVTITDNPTNNTKEIDIDESKISHNNLNDLTVGDPHTQYHNDTRGDARYYTQAQVDTRRMYASAGLTTTPSVTDNGDGTLTVAAGTARLYDNADFTGQIEEYSITGDTFTLIDAMTNYIVADYNSGSPIYKNTTNVLDITESDIIPVVTAYRHGLHVHYFDWDEMALGLSNKLHYRLIKTDRFARQSGLILSESATRIINISDGIVWYGAQSVDLNAIASSTADACDFWYKSSGVWTQVITTQYNNSQYQGATDLVSLLPSKFGVNWIYRSNDSTGEIRFLLGTQEYGSLGAASLAQPPSDVPSIIPNNSILVGRIIVGTGASIASQIDSAFDVTFSGSAVTDHNSLASLQGGSPDEFYHLNSSQYNAATREATAAQNGLMSLTYASKLDGIEASAEQNNISDVDAALLVDGGETTLHDHAASGITSGTFADALIAETNVTQHEAALSLLASQVAPTTEIIVTATRSLALTDANKYIRCTNAAAAVLTIEPNSTVAFPLNTEIRFDSQGAGLVTFAAGAGVTINSFESKLGFSLKAGAALRKTGTDTWTLIGALI